LLIGPNDFEPSLPGKALIDMYHGRMPVLLGIDSDCTDARDVAQGIIAAAERGRIGERYLLSGQVATMKDMATWWQEATGKTMLRHSRTNHNISCAKAKRELGYQPRPLRESFFADGRIFQATRVAGLNTALFA
jgi:nucleoside-diphosphate-sugar epimerase